MNPHQRRGRRPSAIGLLEAAGLLLGLATLAGFAGRHTWWLDGCSHFRPHYFVLLIAVGSVFAIIKRPVVAAILGGAALVNLAVIGRGISWYSPPWPPSASQVCRLLEFNVNTANQNHPALLREVATWSPDLILLLEVDAVWLGALSSLSNVYPRQILAPRDDNFGIALLSHVPIHDGRVETWGSAGVPSLVGRVRLAGRELLVAGTHPVPPAGNRQWIERNEQLAELADWCRLQRLPVVLAGDLNLTPWSPWFVELMHRGGLESPSGGRWLNTWPTFLPAPMGIPIDHVLTRGDVRVIGHERSPLVGSDHHALRITFRLD